MLRLSRKYILNEFYKNSEYISKRFGIGLPRRPTKGAPLMKYLRKSVKEPGIPELIIDIPPDQHQNIQTKLNKINYYDNAINLVNIGFDDNSSVKKNVLNARQCLADRVANDQHYDYDTENVNYDIDYLQISNKWLITEEGQRDMVAIANHYAIFRDLFPMSSLPVPQTSIAKIAQKPIYYFNPLITVNAEFCVEEECNDNEEAKQANIIGSPVNRGNLILPAKCINAPNVVIDCSAVNGIELDKVTDEHQSFNEISGCIKLVNSNDNAFYTLALINLDSLFGSDSVCCHWLITNIHNQNNITKYDTSIEYLPVFGIKGLGYHRYVVLVYRHNNCLDLPFVNDFDLTKRKFDAFKFINDHKQCEITPIGLSWFQSLWDFSSQKIFYDYLDMRSPVYEYKFPKDTQEKQLQFPHKRPFNIYLDSFRDPKEIAKEVLLERLSSIHPYKYDNLFDVNPLPHVHRRYDLPGWQKFIASKRNFRSHHFRALRPPSAIRPLNNNADLDTPPWPRITNKLMPLDVPNRYPDGKRRPKPLRETKWVLPFNEHPTYRVEYPDSSPEDYSKKLRNK